MRWKGLTFFGLVFGFGWDKTLSASVTIAEPWDEGDGKEWANSGCRPGDLSAAVWAANPGAMPGEGPQATDGRLSRRAAQSPPHTRWPTATRPGLTSLTVVLFSLNICCSFVLVCIYIPRQVCRREPGDVGREKTETPPFLGPNCFQMNFVHM